MLSMLGVYTINLVLGRIGEILKNQSTQTVQYNIVRKLNLTFLLEHSVSTNSVQQRIQRGDNVCVFQTLKHSTAYFLSMCEARSLDGVR
jgi:hypothetical protein